MATSQANKGKSLESRFKALCEVYEGKAKFSAHRFPDAHAGSRVPTLADFQTLYAGKLRLVECKEVAFDHRLPHKNFRSDQVARMRKWQLAGAESWVLIHHTTGNFYRVLPVDRFLDRSTGGSWKFTAEEGFVTDNLDSAFRHIHGAM